MYLLQRSARQAATSSGVQTFFTVLYKPVMWFASICCSKMLVMAAKLQSPEGHCSCCSKCSLMSCAVANSMLQLAQYSVLGGALLETDCASLLFCEHSRIIILFYLSKLFVLPVDSPIWKTLGALCSHAVHTWEAAVSHVEAESYHMELGNASYSWWVHVIFYWNLAKATKILAPFRFTVKKNMRRREECISVTC